MSLKSVISASRPRIAWLSYRLRHQRVENKGLKVLSLVLAFALFAVSRQPQRDVLLVDVPLNFLGLSSGLEISGSPPVTVNVRLRGPQDVVRSLTANQLEVTADLSNKGPGERVVQLKLDDVRRPDNVQVLRVEPASVTLHLEATRRKSVPVTPRFVGEIPKGYERYGLHLEPDTVEVEGPKSELKDLSQILTESVQLDDRRSSFETPLDLEIKSGVRVLTPAPVRLRVEIGETRKERTFRQVPVVWSNQPPSVHLLTPSVAVTLLGPPSVIDSLKEADLRAEIRPGKLSEDGQEVEPEIIWPPGLRYLEVKEITPKQVRVRK